MRPDLNDRSIENPRIFAMTHIPMRDFQSCGANSCAKGHLLSVTAFLATKSVRRKSNCAKNRTPILHVTVCVSPLSNLSGAIFLMARFRRQLRRFSSVAGNIFENMWYKVPFLLLLIQHSVSSTGSSSSHKHAPFRIDKICNQANHSSTMPPKPRTTFSPPGGHTQDDQRIDWEHRETLKRSRTERLKPFSGKGDYLEELQKRKIHFFFN
jgi:hypothetical protein